MRWSLGCSGFGEPSFKCSRTGGTISRIRSLRWQEEISLTSLETTWKGRILLSSKAKWIIPWIGYVLLGIWGLRYFISNFLISFHCFPSIVYLALRLSCRNLCAPSHLCFLINQIYVFFPVEEKSGVSVIKSFLSQMKADEVRSAILVLQKGLTPAGKLAVSEYSAHYRMEIFEVNVHTLWCYFIEFTMTNCSVLGKY